MHNYCDAADSNDGPSGAFTISPVAISVLFLGAVRKRWRADPSYSSTATGRRSTHASRMGSWWARPGGIDVYTREKLHDRLPYQRRWCQLDMRQLARREAPLRGGRRRRSAAAKVFRLPTQKWRFINEDAAIRHLGPMAQDFRAAFLGTDDRTIATVDENGVALAAVQAQNKTAVVDGGMNPHYATGIVVSHPGRCVGAFRGGRRP